MHEWEQIDQGEAYCLKCGETNPNTDCKREEPKPAKSDTIPPRSPSQEIESIKRTLYNAIDKLDRLTAK